MWCCNWAWYLFCTHNHRRSTSKLCSLLLWHWLCHATFFPCHKFNLSRGLTHAVPFLRRRAAWSRPMAMALALSCHALPVHWPGASQSADLTCESCWQKCCFGQGGDACTDSCAVPYMPHVACFAWREGTCVKSLCLR